MTLLTPSRYNDAIEVASALRSQDGNAVPDDYESEEQREGIDWRELLNEDVSLARLFRRRSA